MQFDSQHFPNTIKNFLRNCVITDLLQIAGIYKNETTRIMKAFQNSPIRAMDGPSGLIKLSRDLHLLTASALSVLNGLENEAIEYQNIMSRTDFYMKQEYNMVLYKLYTTTNKIKWRDFAWANYVTG